MKHVPDFTYASPNHSVVKRRIIRSIERLAGKKKILKLYESIPEEMAGHPLFFYEAIKVLKVDLDWDQAQLQKIPKNGPLIFIANHPFGVLDGIIMCNLAATHRNAWGIMINEALCRVEHLEKNLLPINFDETREAVKMNIASKKRAMQMLNDGGALVVFPAGGISTATRKGFGKVTDLEWKLFTAKLIQMTKATVVPVYFHGTNSRIFQIVSQFSLTLRLSLVIRELRKQIGKKQKVTIGDPIPYDQMADIRGRQALLDYLREETYSLARTH